MSPKEKEALVELLNAHTNKIVTLVGARTDIQYWTRQNVDKQIEIAERDFLAEPTEVVAT